MRFPLPNQAKAASMLSVRFFLQSRWRWACSDAQAVQAQKGPTSTAMHPHSGQHMPISSLHGAAADWTPKKGGGAASLAESSASPVSVIPKNTRRRPNLAQDAARASPADRHGSTQSGDRRANGKPYWQQNDGLSVWQHSAALRSRCAPLWCCL